MEDIQTNSFISLEHFKIKVLIIIMNKTENTDKIINFFNCDFEINEGELFFYFC